MHGRGLWNQRSRQEAEARHAVGAPVRARIWRYLLLGAITLWAVGQATVGYRLRSSCPGAQVPCTITLTNESFWPLRIDTATITADGVPVLGSGQAVAGPFATTTLTLALATGGPLMQAAVLRYTVASVPIGYARVDTAALHPAS